MIKDEILKIIKSEVSDSVSKLTHDNLNINVDHIKSTMKRNLTISGLLGIGLLFLFLGVAKIIPNFIGISEGTAFFLIGFGLIVVAFIYRAGATT